MYEKKYTREEIFAMLQDPQKFAEFCSGESRAMRDLEQAKYTPQVQDSGEPSDYDRYLVKESSEQPEDITYMNPDGTLYHASNPFRRGSVPKISREEYELLTFCHNTDMIPFLAEEFRRNPINPQDAQDSFERMSQQACSAYIRGYNPNMLYEQNVNNAFDPNDFRREDW